jgi:hypothetical protein
MSVEDLSDELRRYLIKNANRAADRLGVKSKSFGTTEIVRKKVLIGKKMSAELTGPDFEIQPSGPEDQVYIEGRPLRWSWLVKPKHAGPDGLPLEILVVADPGEGRTPEEPIREVLIVYAHARSLKEIFQELDWWIKLVGGSGVGAVGVGVGKWLLARRRVKRRSPKSK